MWVYKARQDSGSVSKENVSHAEASLTLSFDVVDVFTLITGSPLDLSMTTVLSVPLLPK